VELVIHLTKTSFRISRDAGAELDGFLPQWHVADANFVPQQHLCGVQQD
jgi:hypothetical protein